MAAGSVILADALFSPSVIVLPTYGLDVIGVVIIVDSYFCSNYGGGERFPGRNAAAAQSIIVAGASRLYEVEGSCK
jgi:hypothetical protein